MSSTGINNNNPIEWALRVCESIAFFLHGILGMTEPFTGCLKSAFHDNHDSMPHWFWPVAGLLLWIVAILNFYPKNNTMVILAAQAYIASFHMGGVFYHVRLGHHPLTGCAPGVFVVFAFIITAIRTGSMLLPLVGLLVCTLIAYLLSRILVNPTTTPRLTTTPTIDINDDDSDRHDENLLQ